MKDEEIKIYEQMLKATFGEKLGCKLMKFALQFGKIDELEKKVNILQNEVKELKKKINN